MSGKDIRSESGHTFSVDVNLNEPAPPGGPSAHKSVWKETHALPNSTIDQPFADSWDVPADVYAEDNPTVND